MEDPASTTGRLPRRSPAIRTYFAHTFTTARLATGKPPTDDESERYSRQRKFFQALERLPRFTVRLGRLDRRGPDAQGRYTFAQKQVDSLLSVDLAMLAAKHLIQEAAIVAGDSDFIPAVEAAKSEGVLIRLFHGRNPHSDLWTAADERVRFSQELIDSIPAPLPS